MLRLFFILCLSFYGSHPLYATESEPNWNQHIRYHTAGTISKQSTIQIRFSHDVFNEDSMPEDAAIFFEITPNVAGKTLFSNRRTLHFVPSQPLKSGQSYQVQIKTTGLDGFSDAFKRYSFHFNVIKQSLSVNLDALTLQNKNAFKLSGRLETADVADQAQVEKILQAHIANKTLDIQWQHAKNKKRHRFFITDITRTQQPQTLWLAWSAESIEVKESGKHAVEIPSLTSFHVIKMEAVQDKQRYLRVVFSDELDEQQDIQGLVQLNQQAYAMRVQGNQIKIYHNLKGDIRVHIHAGVKNSHGFPLGEEKNTVVSFAAAKPQVRFVGKGVILPSNKQLSIPFESINVHSVQVAAFRIYSDNIGQFLQENNLSENQNLQRLGRFLWRKTIQLKDVSEETWHRFDLDVSKLVKQYPNDMFRLTLSINRSNANYQCSTADQAVEVVKEAPLQDATDMQHNEISAWDASEAYFGLNDDSSWKDRSDPCKDAYYHYDEHTKSERNFLASNIGLIAKRADGNQIHVVTTNLATAKAMPRVRLQFYNFQNQLIGRAQTDVYGFSRKTLTQTPFYLLARKGKQKAYLKLNQGSALPTSHFDVSGEKVNKGVKGHIYAERGVWRPGDAMFLTFVLLDNENRIPQTHPVSMRLYNPRGQLMQTLHNNTPVGRFYSFQFKTDENAPTGRWRVDAHLGGMTFHKYLRIETVRPNRLKMDLDFGSDVLRRSQDALQAQFSAQWLHGASAAGLKADVNVRLSAMKTSFSSYQNYIFDDPSRHFSGKTQAWFKGKLNDKGEVKIQNPLPKVSGAAGMLKATFRSRVFEKGGAFSVDRMSVPYHTYAHYVGIQLPKGDRTRGMLLTDEKHPIQIVSVDSYGEPISLEKVQVTVYKIHWKWWWDKSGDALAQYASSSYTQNILQQEVQTVDGIAQVDFEIKAPEWGRYLVRACDVKGGHCAGKVVYVDWPGWAGRAQENTGSAATRLALSTDKAQYQVGETALIQLPNASQGRALLSIENSHQVLHQQWVLLNGKRKAIKVAVTQAMAPNAYVHISLIQPHQNKKNDLPIRLYGIVPIKVIDPTTILQPVLDVADEVRPERNMRVDVQEKTGRAMTYTLAVVDEGLLGLTRFHTPDLHQVFYQKEALGVRTWDVFDDVVGAYGGALERLLALGGGDTAKSMQIENKKRRFPPVVQFLGPFTLAAGQKASHDIMLPQYMGAVRVMLVAGTSNAYGHIEKSVIVRDPLSILVTMPRVLSPDEILTIPVSLFAMHAGIDDVTLQLEVDDYLEILGDDKQHIHFEKTGEKMGFIRLKVKSHIGQTTLHFSARSGMYQATATIHIDVRLPNAATQRSYRQRIEAGQAWSAKIMPHGIAGTNQVSLEVSTLPPMNLSGRLHTLVKYPHGCVEQTVSAVFPQVFLTDLVQTSEERRDIMATNVQAGIVRLQRFQLQGGGFSYWPNGESRHAWATSYVGHFLLEAKKQGYQVSSAMLAAWVMSQKKIAKMTILNSQTALDQAYRLYTLALAGEAELGAMNRLREFQTLTSLARWQLSSAYRLASLPDVADALVQHDLLKKFKEQPTTHQFASEQRDQAMLLYALALKGDVRSEAYAQKIAKVLSSDTWLNTQEIAFSLLALTTYAHGYEQKEAFRFEQIVGVESELIQPMKPVYLAALRDFPDMGESISILNQSNQTLYATVLVRGVPKVAKEKAINHGISLQLNYRDDANKTLNIRKLKQGQDVQVTIRVRNRSNHDLENVALSHVLPSGWEIMSANKPQGADYQDVRDDRIYRYFSLKRGKERIFHISINAAYIGQFYMPSVLVEDMYDANTRAQSVGAWVEVAK